MAGIAPASRRTIINGVQAEFASKFQMHRWEANEIPCTLGSMTSDVSRANEKSYPEVIAPKVAIQEENHPRWLSTLSDSGRKLHRLERSRDQRLHLARK